MKPWLEEEGAPRMVAGEESALTRGRKWSRRRFLRSGAVCLALPWLESVMKGAEAAAGALKSPMRMLLVGRPLGTHADYFFPKQTGLQYEASRYLRILEGYRGRFTVFSGMSHVGYPHVHHTEAGLFTGVSADRIQRLENIRNTISLDQWVVERVGGETRHPCLLLGRTSTLPMVYSRSGVALPTEDRLDRVFRRLFLDGTREEVAQEVSRLSEGRSILDQVSDQLKRLGREVGNGDRDRLDLMATSIRSAERELKQREAWASNAKPKVARRMGDYAGASWSAAQRLRYDLAFLAFQTDSTRVVVSVEAPGEAGEAPGTVLQQHDASHHGKDPRKIEQLAMFEEEETRNLKALLDQLESVKEGGQSLLDRTVVFWGSNLGNPSAHSSLNLPIFLAGGGFKHAGHVRFDETHNMPLSNLYVRMLRQMGIPAEKFGASTGVLDVLG